MIKAKQLYEKFMNTKNLIIILIIGITLLVMPSLFTQSSGESKHEQKYQFNFKEYENALEGKLSAMLSQINGAGKVSVMITFSDSGRYVYSQEEQTEKSETSHRGNLKPVLKSSSSGEEEPILIKTELPKISGVLVIAQGADNSRVKENIIESVKAVLDVNISNISVMAK